VNLPLNQVKNKTKEKLLQAHKYN